MIQLQQCFHNENVVQSAIQYGDVRGNVGQNDLVKFLSKTELLATLRVPF